MGVMLTGALAVPMLASAQSDDHDRRDRARQDDRRRDDRRVDSSRHDDRYRDEAARDRRIVDDHRFVDAHRRDEIVRRDDRWRGYDAGFGVRIGGGNEWGQIALVAGGVGLLGALEHDDTLCFVGTAGALYSFARYEDDLHSDDRACRLRAEYFSRPYFYRDGRRFERVEVNRHGDRFYRFVAR